MDDLERQVRKNLILKDIPVGDLVKLIPYMNIEEVDAKKILHQAGEPIRYIFFPITALMSMLMPASEGGTVELATVGREGLTGMSVLLNGSPNRDHGALTTAITIIPGTVIKMKSDAFKAAADTSLSVARCLRGYLSLLFTELALSVICNRLHSLEQRCARWLLTGMDKSGTSEMPVTQETMARILGVSRQSIVQTMSDFQMKGLIYCGRGTIGVTMRKPLMEIACECYSINKKRMMDR